MSDGYTPGVANVSKVQKSQSAFAKASFILAVVPPAVLFIVFIFSFIISGGFSPNDAGGAIWWVLIAAVTIIAPIAAVTGVLSVIFGIIAIIRTKTVFAWVGIIIIIVEILGVLAFFLFA